MILLTLVRRHLRDIRWSLGTTVLAFFGLAILWNWGVSRYQFPPPETPAPASSTEEATTSAENVAEVPAEVDQDSAVEANEPAGLAEPAVAETEDAPAPSRRGRSRGRGIYIGMGVPPERMFDPDDPPTMLMQVSMANHPLILLALIGWAIARGSSAVAGEIERGTLDMTLTRPVRRSTYLASQVIVALLIFVLLSLAFAVGHRAAPVFFELRNLPNLSDYVRSALMMTCLGLAIFGYTLVFSSRDISRARAGILGLGVTLAGLAGIIFSQQLEGYTWLARLSVFDHYAPVGLSLEWSGEMRNKLVVLAGVFLGSLVLSFVLFLRRDLPTSGG